MSKTIVVPGELLSTETKTLGLHTYSLDGKVYADVLGLKMETDDKVSVIPLKGRYVPVENDVIIGVVKNEKFAGYDIDINSFYPSFVNKQELREPLHMASIVSAKIVHVNEVNEVDLGMVRPLHQGEIVSVAPVKVPRLIGKNASMLNVVRNGTGSTIMVGRNGLIFVKGGNTSLAVDVLKLIEEYSHIDDLTNYVQHYLAEKTGNGIPETQGPSNESAFETGMSGGYSRGGFRPRPGGRPNFSRPTGRPSFGNRNNNRPFNNRGRDTRNNFSSGNTGFRQNNRFGNNFSENRDTNFRGPRPRRFERRDTVRGDEDPSFD